MIGYVSVALLLLIATMRLFPETATARVLHRWLVEAPVNFVFDGKWLRLLAGVVLLVLMMAGPEIAMIIGAAGIDAAFIELLLAAMMAGALGRVRETVASLRRAVTRAVSLPGRLLARNRAPRARRQRKSQRPGKTDDSTGPAWGSGLVYV